MSSKIFCECDLRDKLKSPSKTYKLLENGQQRRESSIESATAVRSIANSSNQQRKKKLPVPFLTQNVEHLPSANLSHKKNVVEKIGTNNGNNAISENDKRKHIDRQRFLNLRWAAIVLQRAFRTKRLKNVAALKIQSWIRGTAVRKKFKQLSKAVVAVQSLFRGRVARQRYLQLKRATIDLQRKWRALYAKLFLAVIFIQQRYRYLLHRRREKSAIKIQAWIRGNRARQNIRNQLWWAQLIKKLWEAYLISDLDRLDLASLTIQRSWRWRRKWRATVKIQSWFRGCLNRQLNKVQLPKHIEPNSTSVLLLIVGGFDPNKPRVKTEGSQFSSHQIWKNNFIQENRWELVGHMIKALRYPGYALRDDLIYVTGGFDGNVKKVCNECQVLNIKECKWTQGPSLNIPRNQHACCSAGQFIAVFGGISHDNRLLDTIEVLDGEGLSWVLRKSRLSQPRAAMAIAHSYGFYGHLIWLCGGVEMYGRQLVSVNEIECYDFDNDQMIPLQFSLLTPRAFAAAVVCERVVYVVGGVDGEKYMEDIEVFRLESLRTLKGGSLKYLRRGLKAVEYDGCVIVVGGKGQDNSDDLKKIEIMARKPKNIQIANLPKPLLGFGCFIYQPGPFVNYNN